MKYFCEMAFLSFFTFICFFSFLSINIDVRQREAHAGIVLAYRPDNIFVAGTMGSPRLMGLNSGSYVMALSLVGSGRAGLLAIVARPGRLVAFVGQGKVMIGCGGLGGPTLAGVGPG